MPLRRSPRLTSAFLEANRRNAQKSTGPRTVRGKQAVILNALDHGQRSRWLMETLARASLPQQLEFARLFTSLYYAMAPEPREIGWVMQVAAWAWRRKRQCERGVRTPDFRAAVAEHQGWLPEPWRLRLRRPGWRVTVTVSVRCRRGSPGREADPPRWWDGKRPMDARVMVQSSLGRVWRPNQGPLTAWGRLLLASEWWISQAAEGAGEEMTFKAGMLQIIKELTGLSSRSMSRGKEGVNRGEQEAQKGPSSPAD
ncbi:MAG TPA: hypothetical protein VI455_09555 [Terriglobia bacterium]